MIDKTPIKKGDNRYALDDHEYVGKRYGKLEILKIFREVKENDTRPHTRRYASCLCDCGNSKSIQLTSLTSGNTISCGCYHREKVMPVMYKLAPHYKRAHCNG